MPLLAFPWLDVASALALAVAALLAALARLLVLL
jgi:hypothetical protein